MSLLRLIGCNRLSKIFKILKRDELKDMKTNFMIADGA